MPRTSPTSLDELDPAAAWEPWEPGPGDPWGLKWAGHLYRRAAFGATWEELRSAVDEGPEAAVERLLAGGDGQADFDGLMDDLAPEISQNQMPAGNDGGLAAWWLYRIIHTGHPLRERMALFWHNHFATSIAKVRQPAAMLRQNRLVRNHALGSFRALVQEMSRDPAMLIWLDSNSNVRGRPNENYARELMELFTLGVGHYTEADVKEAARAFTGWHTDGQKFVFNRYQHDGGPKAVLGQAGPWDGGDVVRIVLEQPAAARFLARKLYRQFISESEEPPDGLLEPLAGRLRASDYDIKDLVRTVLRSRHFFSAHAHRRRIKGPVEYLVGMLRALEAKPVPGADSFPTPPTLAGLLDGLGQTLFAPPNVKGWAGGESWLNSATLLARHNLAWSVVRGGQGPLAVRVNPAALVRKHARPGDPEGQVDFLLGLLLQAEASEVDGRARDRLVEFLADGSPAGAIPDRRLRETIHAILLMPEYQVA